MRVWSESGAIVGVDAPDLPLSSPLAVFRAESDLPLQGFKFVDLSEQISIMKIMPIIDIVVPIID